MDISIIDLTDGWLTDWAEEGGWFKEWVRSLNLTAINHGWFYSLSREPKRFYENVTTLISWVPVLWGNHDWDHVFLFQIMHHKIRKMRIYQETHGISLHAPKMAKQLRIAEECLDRLIKDEYNQQDYDAYHAKYPTASEWIKEPSGLYRSTKISDEQYKELKSISDKQEYLRKQDLRLFSQLFEKHVRTWWD